MDIFSLVLSTRVGQVAMQCAWVYIKNALSSSYSLRMSKVDVRYDKVLEEAY